MAHRVKSVPLRRKPHRFVPGKCRALTYQRPPIDRLLRRLHIVYNIQDDYDRELLTRAVFVEEALRISLNGDNNHESSSCDVLLHNAGYEITSGNLASSAAADAETRYLENDTCKRDTASERLVYSPPHRCSDPRSACTDVRSCNSAFLKHASCGYLLQCVSMYFSYFYDIPRVYHVEPLECDGGGDGVNNRGDGTTPSVPFGAIFDSQARELYICCNERILENSLLAAESVPDQRLIVNDMSVNAACYSSTCDRRVFTILAFLANVERLVYDSLIAVTRERTLAELTFVDDGAASTQNRNSKPLRSGTNHAALTITPIDTNAGIVRGHLRDVDLPDCFL